MGSLVDLTGQVFGRLTVTQRGPDYVSPGGRRCVRWRCSCSCGESVLVYTDNLRAERTKSCGCWRVERSRHRNDLTGRRFALLVVLEMGPPTAAGYSTCLARCDCGTEVSVQAGNLIQGNTKSCGCLRHRSGERHPLWKGDDIGYTAAHYRVRSQFGPASEHRCIGCGEPAYAWTYDHLDPEELLEFVTLPHGREAWVPYSTDPCRYQPRCNSCHVAFDAAYRKSERARCEHRAPE